MAISRNAQIALFISSSTLGGTARTLKTLDKNNTGADDIAGNLCSVASDVLLAVATEDLKDLKAALKLNIETSQKLLNEIENGGN